MLIFFLYMFIEARIKDSVTISVDDADFSPSKTEMKNMLAKADLKGHGYQKEETIKKTKDSSGREIYRKALYYFKVVKCSQAGQIIQELKDLLPGNVCQCYADLFCPMKFCKFCYPLYPESENV